MKVIRLNDIIVTPSASGYFRVMYMTPGKTEIQKVLDENLEPVQNSKPLTIGIEHITVVNDNFLMERERDFNRGMNNLVKAMEGDL